MQTDPFIRFLTQKGGQIISHINSDTFDDSIMTIRAGYIQFTFIRDRSINSIEIQSVRDSEKFDIRLLKALLSDERDFTLEYSDSALISFLETSYDKIQELFKPNKYSSTKLTLKQMELARTKQLFPSQFK